MTKIKNRIFITSALKSGETVSLEDDKSHYVNNVIRCKIGDHNSLFNDKTARSSFVQQNTVVNYFLGVFIPNAVD